MKKLPIVCVNHGRSKLVLLAVLASSVELIYGWIPLRAGRTGTQVLPRTAFDLSATKTALAYDQPFRDTAAGELSVVSFNVLAPSYHALSYPEEDREGVAKKDRDNRMPGSIRVATRSNADVLCLQEVENDSRLKDWLVESTANGSRYDRMEFSLLHPKREHDTVGLCVAWRSNKHKLVSCHRFRRGMLVKLRENDTSTEFLVANIHLPGRPGNIDGRLKVISYLLEHIKKLTTSSSPKNPLDGSVTITGDFNSEATTSMAVKLLKNGSVPHGKLYERNYRYKLTKEKARQMTHGWRFRDVYGDATRKTVAAITVSTSGRSPGSVDHIFFSPKTDRRALWRQAVGDLSVETVLSTINFQDSERRTVIEAGLPNMEAGFPSDHLAIGTLLAPIKYKSTDAGIAPAKNEVAVKPATTPLQRRRANARQKKMAFTSSIANRNRHNHVLRLITKWLKSRGVTNVIQDKPLYKWEWVKGAHLTKKSRAPDIACVSPKRGVLLVVEVTVTQKLPSVVMKEKRKKYSDLSRALESAPHVKEAGLTVPATHVVVVTDKGMLPSGTMEELSSLSKWTSSAEEEVSQCRKEARYIESEVQRIFQESNY